MPFKMCIRDSGLPERHAGDDYCDEQRAYGENPPVERNPVVEPHQPLAAEEVGGGYAQQDGRQRDHRQVCLLYTSSE